MVSKLRSEQTLLAATGVFAQQKKQNHFFKIRAKLIMKSVIQKFLKELATG